MKKISLILLIFLFLAGTGNAFGYQEEGIASWYGGHFHGRLTANGEIFNTHELTAAHKLLPFNTLVTVTNLNNGKSIQVRINDRGPFVDGRIIDLSHAAAAQLDMIGSGTAAVHLKVDNMEILDLRFTIQVGAYHNLENAAAVKKKLEAQGFAPEVQLNKKGITRILLCNIPEEETFVYASKLKEMGITNILIKQN